MLVDNWAQQPLEGLNLCDDSETNESDDADGGDGDDYG